MNKIWRYCIIKKEWKEICTNLIDSINASKENDLYRLITALGIRHVGGKASKMLARKYRTMDNLANATFEELSEIKDIGEVMANSIREIFFTRTNIRLVKQIKKKLVLTWIV